MSLLSKFVKETHTFFITGGVMSLGDYVAQKVVEKKQELDVMRNIRFGVLGVLWVAPVLHYWFKFLDKKFVGNHGIQPLKKLITDQTLMPTFINGSTLVLLEVLQRRDWHEIKHKLRHSLPSILVTQYKIWPAVQLLNFYLVPIQYRLLVVVFVAFFWNIYLANALQNPIH